MTHARVPITDLLIVMLVPSGLVSLCHNDKPLAAEFSGSEGRDFVLVF